MKKFLVPTLALAALSTLGCFTGSDGSGSDSNPVKMEVSPYKVPCNSLMAQSCLVVKRSSDTAATTIYENIDGFTFEWGVRQVLTVDIEDLPRTEDGPTHRYTKVGVVKRTAEPDWEFHNFHYGHDWTLVGDTLRIFGYERAILIPDPADRGKLSAMGEREILEMDIRSGEDGLLEARSITVRQPG